ncbi:MAG: helix-turn-helix domain-containing protein, partial [Streptosporangiaceae bacterium]
MAVWLEWLWIDVARVYRGDADLPPGPVRDLRDLLRRLRQRQGSSLGQIAARAGLSRSHLSEVLRGWNTPSPQAAERIARALGATEAEVSRARQWAERARELQSYLRAHGAPARGGVGVGVAPIASDREATATTGEAPGVNGDLLAGLDHAHDDERTGTPPAGHEVFGEDHGSGRVGPVVDVFPVAIGRYEDAGLADLDVEAAAGRLVEVLAPFGGRHRPWAHPFRERGADAVQRRLRQWADLPRLAADADERGDHLAVAPVAGCSVLYWAGHGWSDGTRTALAHAQSPAAVGGSGLEPQQLAQAIRARQAAAGAQEQAGGAGGWAMVIVETSHAAQIADAVMAALHGPDAPARLLLVAIPSDGA